MGSTLKAWVSSASLVVLSIAVALCLGEILVRIVSPQDLRFNVTQWDEYLGFWHIPDIEGYTKHRDYTMRIEINSKGLRDKEYAYDKPERTIRVGVFGDSFTFGEGVQNDKTYAAVLERLFGSDTVLEGGKWSVEVLNFGVGKTGTSHQYALYQKEGTKYDLDIVVLAFLGGNDFEDNLAGVFLLKDGKLVHNPAAYSSVREIQRIVYRIPFYKWLASNSHLVNFLRIVATRADDRRRERHHSNSVGGARGDSGSGINPASMQLTEKLVDEFRGQVERDGGRFIFMNLPAKNQKLARNYMDEEIVPPYVKPTAGLLLYLVEQNTVFMDLVPTFSTLPIEKYYFKHDGHMTSAGHMVIAEKLFEFVRPCVLELANAESMSHDCGDLLN